MSLYGEFMHRLMLPLISARYHLRLEHKSPILQAAITVGGVAEGMEKKVSSHRDKLYAMAFWWKVAILHELSCRVGIACNSGLLMFRIRAPKGKSRLAPKSWSGSVLGLNFDNDG